MKFFIDTADIAEIKQAAELGILDGITTNPSLIAKTGKDRNAVIKEICSIVKGSVSAEVVSVNTAGMLEEAAELSKIAPNVTIKLPLIPDGLKACKVLSEKGVQTNVTLCFTPMQALLAAKAGATYVSPFVGRLDDISTDGMAIIEEIRQIYHNYSFKTQILVASVRHPIHVKTAALMGADVVTVPFKVFDQLVKHPLTDSGLEKFLEDYRKSQKK